MIIFIDSCKKWDIYTKKIGIKKRVYIYDQTYPLKKSYDTYIEPMAKYGKY